MPFVGVARGRSSGGGILVPGGNIAISRSFTPPIVANRLGGGPPAVSRAIAMVGVANAKAFPVINFSNGGADPTKAGSQLNPVNGNLFLQISPPRGDQFTLLPVLSYCSTNASTSSEIGNGWSHTFKRTVQLVNGTTPQVITGAGQVYTYTGVSGGGFQIPTSNTVNSLSATSGWASFTETQPDGTFFQYGPVSNGFAPLLYIQNPAGARWTVAYDSSSRVQSITDPYLRKTSLSYDPVSGMITSIQDPVGRITTVSVNSAGNLNQVITPELCMSSLRPPDLRTDLSGGV
jgi:YD repeat-containing protein